MANIKHILYEKDSDVPLTSELLNEIVNTESLDNFFATNHVYKYTLADYLAILLEEKNLKQPEVIKQAGLNATYGYEIFTGRKKKPSRDVVVKLALAMHVNLDDANKLLKISDNSELYSKCKRDVILIYAIVHGYDVAQTNDELYRFDEPLLGEAK